MTERRTTDKTTKNTRPAVFSLTHYWVNGAAIGSELFVKEVMSRARPGVDMKKRRLSRAVDMARNVVPLCCCKQLRVMTC